MLNREHISCNVVTYNPCIVTFLVQPKLDISIKNPCHPPHLKTIRAISLPSSTHNLSSFLYILSLTLPHHQKLLIYFPTSKLKQPHILRESSEQPKEWRNNIESFGVNWPTRNFIKIIYIIFWKFNKINPKEDHKANSSKLKILIT